MTGLLPGSTFGLQCFIGRVFLFRFIMAPPPGSIIASLTLQNGQQISLRQTQEPFPGGLPLSAADGQFALVCGVPAADSLDVRFVAPIGTLMTMFAPGTQMMPPAGTGAPGMGMGTMGMGNLGMALSMGMGGAGAPPMGGG